MEGSELGPLERCAQHAELLEGEGMMTEARHVKLLVFSAGRILAGDPLVVGDGVGGAEHLALREALFRLGVS